MGVILISKRFMKIVTAGFATGITLWPFIILKDKDAAENKVLLNHEKIHLRQQIEMLVLPFYIWYLTEYLVRLIKYRNRYQAYRNISFEREAYNYEKHAEYLTQRKFWSFLKHI